MQQRWKPVLPTNINICNYTSTQLQVKKNKIKNKQTNKPNNKLKNIWS